MSRDFLKISCFKETVVARKETFPRQCSKKLKNEVTLKLLNRYEMFKVTVLFNVQLHLRKLITNKSQQYNL